MPALRGTLLHPFFLVPLLSHSHKKAAYITADNLGCFDTSSNTLSIDFCNIREIRSNFQSVEHHFSSTKALRSSQWEGWRHAVSKFRSAVSMKIALEKR